MDLKLPIASGLYGVDSTYTDVQHSSQFGNTRTIIEQRTYKDYVSFVEYGASIAATLIRFVLNCVINIFVGRSITQVRSSVIVPISIYMANHHSRRARTNKRFSYHGMDILGCLSPILRSLPKGYRQVVCGGVRFSNKPLTVFNRRNFTKAANLVPIMTQHGLPKFRSICHG